MNVELPDRLIAPLTNIAECGVVGASIDEVVAYGLTRFIEGVLQSRGWRALLPAEGETALPDEKQHRKSGWSLAEDQVLRDHYPSGGRTACRDLLPARSDLAIRVRASKLGIRRVFDYTPKAKPSFAPAPKQLRAPEIRGDIDGKVWCGQCDKRVPLPLARDCTSKFCKAGR
jgi:hypothetical protein